MAQPGDIRWNDQAEQFEILVERRYARDEWRPLQEERPELFSQLAAVVKSGLFDAVDNASESGVVIFHNAQTDEWMDKNEAVTAWTNLSTYGERPVNWPDYEEWPPTRLQTSAEAKEAGNVDEAGKPVPARIVNPKAVTAARESETKYLAAQEKDARDYQAQQANIATDNKRAQEALDLQKEEFAYRQQQDALKAQAAPNRPSSLIGLMAEALDSGNIDRARGLWEFENQITPLQYLQLTMEYADNPEALKVLFDFVQARRPGIIGGQGQGPVSGQQSPSQQAGFAPGSYTARSFDAQDPATQQQYLLGQQYKAAGGLLPSDIRYQQLTSGAAPGGAFQPSASTAFGGPTNQPGGEIGMEGTKPVFQPSAQTAEKSGGLLGASPFLQGKQDQYAADPWYGVSNEALQAIINAPESSDEDRAAAQAELGKRPTNQPVDNSTFEGFMSGFKPFADTPKQASEMAANLAAGNPYAGKVLATDPKTGQWTNWVDQGTGEIFSEQAGGGIKTTGVFNPVTPKPATAPSPFNPVDLEGYLKAAQTLSASKKPKQRSPFGAPVFRRAM